MNHLKYSTRWNVYSKQGNYLGGCSRKKAAKRLAYRASTHFNIPTVIRKEGV